jgi:hypothetical protein
MKAFGIMGGLVRIWRGDDSGGPASPPKRKNPPRMAAGGFWAEQISLTRTPCLTGPVNRHADDLSTAVDRHAGHDAAACTAVIARPDRAKYSGALVMDRGALEYGVLRFRGV